MAPFRIRVRMHGKPSRWLRAMVWLARKVFREPALEIRADGDDFEIFFPFWRPLHVEIKAGLDDKPLIISGFATTEEVTTFVSWSGTERLKRKARW